MVYANFCGVENAQAFTGLSCISDPYCINLARAGHDDEATSAQVDLALITEARTRLPYLRDHQKISPDLNLSKDP